MFITLRRCMNGGEFERHWQFVKEESRRFNRGRRMTDRNVVLV